MQTAAEAERLATEGKAVRRDQKSMKLLGNNFLPLTSREPESEDEENLNLSEEEEWEELMATLADLKARRENKTERQMGWRKATSSTKCYKCGCMDTTGQIAVYEGNQGLRDDKQPTLSNCVSTVRWKPLRQRVPTVGNGETIA